MSLTMDRFGRCDLDVKPGWRTTHLIQPSRLFGASGIRAGQDGLIYVAQLAGCQTARRGDRRAMFPA